MFEKLFRFIFGLLVGFCGGIITYYFAIFMMKVLNFIFTMVHLQTLIVHNQQNSNALIFIASILAGAILALLFQFADYQAQNEFKNKPTSESIDSKANKQ